MIHTLLLHVKTLFYKISLTMPKTDFDLFLTMSFGLCFVELELVIMRYLVIKFILVFLNLLALCGSYYLVVDSP
jgi:hypothetical protein